MPTVEVSFSALPAHVRTARLIALAVARRAGVDEGLLDEVRLAVGEACALLVGHDVLRPSPSPVEVRMRVEDRLRVSVVAAGSVAAQDAPTSDIDGVEPWALLRGLIDDFEITQDGGTTVLSMSWPLSQA